MSTRETRTGAGAATPATHAEVVVLAGAGEWLPAGDDDDPPSDTCWREHWQREASFGFAADLIVAPPEVSVATLKGLLDRNPESAVLMVAPLDDAKGEEFLGTEQVFFVPPPSSVSVLRTYVREVLMFRQARNSSAAAGQEIPTVREIEPVSGWFELTGPTHPVFLRRFHAWIDVLRGTDLDPSELRRLAHAVREIGWNAIEWGNRFDLSRTLKLSFLRLEDRLLFRIEDEGQSGDWMSGQVGSAPAVEQLDRVRDGRGHGGFGMLLVRKIMDKIEVSSGGNIVVMEKRLPGSPEGEAD